MNTRSPKALEIAVRVVVRLVVRPAAARARARCRGVGRNNGPGIVLHAIDAIGIRRQSPDARLPGTALGKAQQNSPAHGPYGPGCAPMPGQSGFQG